MIVWLAYARISTVSGKEQQRGNYASRGREGKAE